MANILLIDDEKRLVVIGLKVGKILLLGQGQGGIAYHY